MGPIPIKKSLGGLPGGMAVSGCGGKIGSADSSMMTEDGLDGPYMNLSSQKEKS